MYCRVDRLEEAIDHLNQAAALARHTGDRKAEGHALEVLSFVDLMRGNPAVAADHARQAIEIFRHAGLPLGEGITLGRLAMACLKLRRFDDAIRYGNESIAIGTDIGDRMGQAFS
ncbi:hypothetical protein Vau01_106090 [Virgisporangium aurantiacum]|uniref:Tetratricopeptide repeat-containing protein n=1 Tax=Virgisporangium aurantiacum TaxID=175570 RepID=A0A8J3ZHV3_9ACTN|nr:hypothetical protein Vau01_106090 [Virgisporangium aurantiacum]